MFRQRYLVIAVAAAGFLWAGCLMTLWGWALDSSSVTTLTGLAAMMIALGLAVRLPRRAAWGVQRILVWLRDREATAAPARGRPLAPGRGDDRTLTRLVGLTVGLALPAGLLSSLALPVVAAIADWLTRRFLWDGWTWTLASALLQFLGAFPLAMGLSVAFLATTLIRHGAGRDGYATTCRDWLAGLALAFAALSGIWAAGLSLILAMAAGGAVLALAAALLLWRGGPFLRPRRFAGAVEPSHQFGRRLRMAACFAGLAATLPIQARLLCDVGGVGMAGQLAWVAASLAGLVAFTARADRKSRPPTAASSLSAMAGLIGGLAMQAAMAMTCLWAQAAGRAGLAALSAGLALAAQLPLAALMGITISRQRRLFAAAGGSARTFFADASLATAAGLLGLLAVLSLPHGKVAFLAVGFGILAGVVLGGMRLVESRRAALRWAAVGAVLFGSLASAVLAPIGQVARWVGVISPGVWWSAVGRQAADGSCQPAGCLPLSSPWRATNVTAALDWILSDKEHRGRWWVLALAGQDVPPPVQGIHMTVSTPAFGGGNHAQDALALQGERLSQSGTRAGGFDGILMCLLPADHPQAWRCYNQQALRDCFRRLQGGGTMMVRVQADLGNLAKVLAAARTFHQVVGSGWAIGEVSQDRLDLLLAGPESAVARPTVAQGAFAMPLQQLWDRWPGIRPIRMTSPSDTGVAAEGSDE